MIMRSLAAIGAVALLTLAAPAQADTMFSFTFNAPTFSAWGDPNDTAFGSGTLTTADADQNGRYYFRSVSGSYFRWDGDTAQPLTSVTGIDESFDPADGFLSADANGTFGTSGVLLFNEFPFDGITLIAAGDGTYGGFRSENFVGGGTLAFTLMGTATPAVPEPGAWALMISGFGLVGGALRYRRRNAAAKFA